MDHSYPANGSKAGFELGASDFRVCALNGRIAKAPLGDNVPYGKGILLQLVPRRPGGPNAQ